MPSYNGNITGEKITSFCSGHRHLQTVCYTLSYLLRYARKTPTTLVTLSNPIPAITGITYI